MQALFRALSARIFLRCTIFIGTSCFNRAPCRSSLKWHRRRGQGTVWKLLWIAFQGRFVHSLWKWKLIMDDPYPAYGLKTSYPVWTPGSATLREVKLLIGKLSQFQTNIFLYCMSSETNIICRRELCELSNERNQGGHLHIVGPKDSSCSSYLTLISG